MKNKTICEEKFNQFLQIGENISNIKSATKRKPALLEIIIPDELANKLIRCFGGDCNIENIYLCWKDLSVKKEDNDKT